MFIDGSSGSARLHWGVFTCNLDFHMHSLGLFHDQSRALLMFSPSASSTPSKTIYNPHSTKSNHAILSSLTPRESASTINSKHLQKLQQHYQHAQHPHLHHHGSQGVSPSTCLLQFTLTSIQIGSAHNKLLEMEGRWIE